MEFCGVNIVKGGKMMFSVTAHREKEKETDLDSLIYRIAEKNTDALEKLYEETKTQVYSYALSILQNIADAEDVMHDSYIKIAIHAGAYRSSGKPMAWIITITKNLCLSKLRANSRADHEQIDDWSEYIASHDGLSYDERAAVMGAMKILKDDEREIVMLHAVSGFKHREIAEHMSLPLSTVLSKYNRAIKKLKNALTMED